MQKREKSVIVASKTFAEQSMGSSLPIRFAPL
jgi:hypothetical protein